MLASGGLSVMISGMMQMLKLSAGSLALGLFFCVFSSPAAKRDS